jgi:hypothetical protein
MEVPARLGSKTPPGRIRSKKISESAREKLLLDARRLID